MVVKVGCCFISIEEMEGEKLRGGVLTVHSQMLLQLA